MSGGQGRHIARMKASRALQGSVRNGQHQWARALAASSAAKIKVKKRLS